MKDCLLLVAAVLTTVASVSPNAAGQDAFDSPMPAPGRRATQPERPAVPNDFPDAGRDRAGDAAGAAVRALEPEPELIELSGRLRRPVKWSPQLDLIPRGRDIERFDLEGALLEGIEDGTPIRVRGVVQSGLHPGDSPQDRSPFPPQRTIRLHVTQLEALRIPAMF